MNDNNACRILLVDSDAGWLNFAMRTLKQRGVRVRGATDIGKVGRAFKFTPGPQLAFVDLEFAERAPDQFQYFAESGNRYVVVLFPTDLTPYRMSRIFKLGGYDCVAKPYDTQSLMKLVESLSKEVGLSTWDTVALFGSQLYSCHIE